MINALKTKADIAPIPARIWPIIECSKVEDVPIDYPGPMGVPITFLDIVMGGRNDGSSGFLIIDNIRPKLNGKDMFQRFVVVNTRFIDGRFQVYKKPNGMYCTAERI